MRRVHVVFTVKGTTDTELHEKAKKELSRFYGIDPLFDSFSYEIYAEEGLVFDGTNMVPGYVGTVTAQR